MDRPLSCCCCCCCTTSANATPHSDVVHYTPRSNTVTFVTPAQDPPQYVVPAVTAGTSSVSDGEAQRANVISHYTIGHVDTVTIILANLLMTRAVDKHNQQPARFLAGTTGGARLQ
jgi:hypothetical protein